MFSTRSNSSSNYDYWMVKPKSYSVRKSKWQPNFWRDFDINRWLREFAKRPVYHTKNCSWILSAVVRWDFLFGYLRLKLICILLAFLKKLAISEHCEPPRQIQQNSSNFGQIPTDQKIVRIQNWSPKKRRRILFFEDQFYL